MTTLKLFDNISRKTDVLPKLGYGLFWVALFVATLGAGNNAYAAIDCTGKQKITANVVVFDSPTVFNRLGAQNPNWITYALKRDVVHKSSVPDKGGQVCQLPNGDDNGCTAGNVELRSDKRPRPLVIRSVEGACLDIVFTNLLEPARANPNNPQQGDGTPGTLEPDLIPFPGLDNNDQVAGRCASFHASGTELRGSMADDGAVVGSNDAGGDLNGPTACGTPATSGLVAPNQIYTYKLYTPHEGAFIINSYGATIGSEANSGNLAVGMFGALNVQPKGARMYRSQMTEEEFRLAINTTIDNGEAECGIGNDPAPGHTCLDQPIIDYEATYPTGSPWHEEGKAGLPIVNMLTTSGELVHSDINAIIAGPDADGSWRSVCAGSPGPDSDCPYPLESVGKRNPAYPHRLEAFREFTSQYHDEQTNSQVFPNWYSNPVMTHVLHGVKDQFMINYGSGGIGSEIISNRLRTGPMHDCTDCAYEEFFLASQTVGDPALLVNSPANTMIEACSPTNILADENTPGGNSCWRIPATEGLANGPIPGNYALYQEDPSNVHHAYTGDPVKMRNTHAGSFEQHIFHFHNHQWLFNPNDDNANYLDAQEIMPGSGHTYELVYGGAGNRNHTVGDAIFHCHFYPHFAQGMWYHMRNHDVYETGTVLDVTGAQDPQNPPIMDDPGAETYMGDDPTTAFDESLDDVIAPFHTTPFALRSGQPAQGSRAYPDGELPDGSPIPAILPMPGKAMPLMPAKVQIVAVDRGSHTLLGGRGGPDGIPDSSQAVVDRTTIGTAENPVSPGYPFWLAGNECGPDYEFDNPATPDIIETVCPNGIVGQRMPTPPLDMLTDHAAATVDPTWTNLGGGWDGGLPRHALLGYTSAGVSADTSNRLDFRKIVHMAQPVYFPETGTDLEKVSMAYQAIRHHPSTFLRLDDMPPVSDGVSFELNGAPHVPGAPYNDPCIDDEGARLNSGTDHKWWGGDGPWTYENGGFITAPASEHDALDPRTYKLANLQIDAVFNKVGYHYAQERIIILWDDVKPTVLKQRPPEPLVMRFNTFDCGKVLHANLVPAEFEVDDFQVRTPTDIIGQHIHLPKWDLTSNDGAANGWNYEDGTLSPGMVHERALAINHYNFLVERCIDTTDCQLPAFHTFYDDKGKLVELHNLGPIDLTDLAPVATLPNACGDFAGDPGKPPGTGEGPDAVPVNMCGTPGGLVKLNDHLPHYFEGFLDTGNPQVGAGMYLSARTTIQRILVDPVYNVSGVDRGLGLTFSHDHYGPSTFQQIGLYSTILAEPAGSTWKHNETGIALNTRHDGGPTSWQAAIETPDTDPETAGKQNPVPDHREFYFEMSDFQHAYEADPETRAGYAQANEFGIPRKLQVDEYGNPIPEIAIVGDTDLTDGLDATFATATEISETWLQSVNPTLKLTAGGGLEKDAFPDTVNAHPNCPGRFGQNDTVTPVPRPCPEAINIGHSSMWVVNYRNEPIGLRVFDPHKMGPDGRKGTQAGGLNENGEFINPQAGDLALAFQSRNDRAISAINKPLGCLDGSCLDTTPAYPQESYCQGTGDGINCDRNAGDPFTPIMRAYEHDHVKVKIQVGATEEQHQTTIHGVKWLSNGSGFGRSPNSGWRNFQSHGISEQFSLQMPIIPDRNNRGNATDYLYATDATRDGIWTGAWGILRSYQNGRNDLYELPDNPMNGSANLANDGNFAGVCPRYVLDKNGDAVGSGKGKNKTLIETPVKQFNVFAVRANDVLPNNLNVIIPPNTNGDSDGVNGGDNEGGPLDPDGGTLVYNRRAPSIQICDTGFFEDENEPGGVGCAVDVRTVAGPLNDPTALMYVLEEDLEPRFLLGEDGLMHTDDDVSPDEMGWDYDDYGDPIPGSGPYFSDGVDDRCQDVKDNGDVNPALHRAGCPVKLKANAPVEPLVLRAEAGDCIEATLWNKLADQATVKKGTEKKLVYVGSNTGTPVFSDVLAAKNVGNLVDEDNILLTPAEEAAIEFDIMPDLAGWQDTFWVVNRDLFTPVADRNQQQMSFFGNNLIRPSAMAGLHAQLVEYDASQDDGVVVGNNPQSIIAGPGEQHTYRWYAGHIDTKFVGMSGKGKNQKRDFVRLAYPVEFGGSNLLSADRIKQPQKGLFGALVIEPKGAIIDEDTLVADGQMACEPARHPEDHPLDGQIVYDLFGNTQCAVPIVMDQDGTRPTRAQVDVEAPAGTAGSGGKYRETVAVTHKITNLRWADGSTVKNIGQAEFGVEGAEDSGHAGYNYGSEPSWFRFGLQPDADVGNAGPKSYGGIQNPQAFYANSLVAGEPNAIPDIPGVAKAGDPQTPVFRTTADQAKANPVFDTRMHVLNGASADRDSTYILHGHVWQRDPFVCTGPVLVPGETKLYLLPPGASDEDTGVPLAGRCAPNAVAPSNALGLNRQAKYMGGEEGMGHVFGHWPILFDAGGTGAVTGDYLFRDYAPNGNRNGMFGILRVE